MGDPGVRRPRDEHEARHATRMLLRDVDAFERMLAEGMFASDSPKAGFEQEMFLIDADGRPAPLASEVMSTAADERLTHELALFNIEANLPPVALGGTFLRDLRDSLLDVCQTVDDAGAAHGARVLLTGILPTLRVADLDTRNMTPSHRYMALNDALLERSDGAFEVSIRGTDYLTIRARSVMLESANTSLQLHLQVSPEDFVARYNLAQLVSGPVLAAAVNSPLLLGRRLWHETRLALFEQAVDARSTAAAQRGHETRVSFGRSWLRGSVLGMLRENAMRFPSVFTVDRDEDPLDALDAGRVPELRHLALHNGTVWRWNRPCFGTGPGGGHLRVENRLLPSGPTVMDEVANAALFYGCMEALRHRGDPADQLPFGRVRANLFAAARQGLDAPMVWVDGRRGPARELLQDVLLPAAIGGLRALQVPEEDIRTWLGIIEQRVHLGTTGARWMLDSVKVLGARDDAAMLALTAAMSDQGQEAPVHTWPLASAPRPPRIRLLVEDVMATDVYTVRPDDAVDLAAKAMDWNGVHHVPVETDHGELVGILGSRLALRVHADRAVRANLPPPPVTVVMDRSPLCVEVGTTLADALKAMDAADADCVLVIASDGALLGLLTERDFARYLP